MRQLLPIFTSLAIAIPSSCFAALFFTQSMVEEQLKGYSQQELSWIQKDLGVVDSVLSCDYRVGPSHLYVATAGPAGSHKSKILEQYLAAHPAKDSFIHLDHDTRVLKFMAHTYLNRSFTMLQASQEKNLSKLTHRAYQKWHAAANYIALSLLEKNFHLKRSIAHGHTLLGEEAAPFLTAVKRHGYRVTLLLCAASDATRAATLQQRGGYHPLYHLGYEEESGRGAGEFALKMPLYFEHADELHLYWSPGCDQQELLAATVVDRVVTVVEPNAYASFVRWYDEESQRCRSQGIALISWSELTQKRQQP